MRSAIQSTTNRPGTGKVMKEDVTQIMSNGESQRPQLEVGV